MKLSISRSEHLLTVSKEMAGEKMTGLLSQLKTQDLGSTPRFRKVSAMADGEINFSYLKTINFQQIEFFAETS